MHTYYCVLVIVFITAVLNILGLEVIGSISVLLLIMVLLPVVVLVFAEFYYTFKNHPIASSSTNISDWSRSIHDPPFGSPSGFDPADEFGTVPGNFTEVPWPKYIRDTWSEVPESSVDFGLYLSVLLWVLSGFDAAGGLAELVFFFGPFFCLWKGSPLLPAHAD